MTSRCLLALGHHGAGAGARVEAVDAGAARADALGQRALRVELELELLGEVLALELLVLADVRRHHLADLPRLEQQSEAESIDARVVGDHGEIARARIAQRQDEILRDAAQAEAAGHHRHAVARQPRECGLGVGKYLLAAPCQAASGCLDGCACWNADMAAQFSAMSASRGYRVTSTPKRDAANNCGTRQQSAIVGVSPWRKLAATGDRARRCALYASSPRVIHSRSHVVTAGLVELAACP